MLPRFFVRARNKFLDGATNEFLTCCSENGKCRGIRFEASTPVVQDQNGVQGAIEDGLEFAFRRAQGARGLVMFTASQKQETGMKSDRHSKSNENEHQQHRWQAPVVRFRQEHSDRQSKYRQSNEDRN